MPCVFPLRPHGHPSTRRRTHPHARLHLRPLGVRHRPRTPRRRRAPRRPRDCLRAHGHRARRRRSRRAHHRARARGEAQSSPRRPRHGVDLRRPRDPRADRAGRTRGAPRRDARRVRSSGRGAHGEHAQGAPRGDPRGVPRGRAAGPLRHVARRRRPRCGLALAAHPRDADAGRRSHHPAPGPPHAPALGQRHACALRPRRRASARASPAQREALRVPEVLGESATMSTTSWEAS